MHSRPEKLILLMALGLSSTAGACGTGAADQDEASDLTESALVSTSTFQKGVSPSSSYAGVTDTTLRESTPTTTDGADASVTADFDDPAASGKHTNCLLRFDVASSPAGSVVSSATLTVNVTNRTSGSGYALYPLSRSWSETQATWQSAASGSAWAAAGAHGASDRSGAAIGSLTPTVTGKAIVTLNAAGVAAVQGWVDSPSTNFGFVVDTGDNADGLAFESSNAAVAESRPGLAVAFAPKPLVSPYPVYTQAEVDAWSTSNSEYTRLASSWAGNVNRAYAAYGTEISSVERDVLKDESVYIKTQAVLWAADGNVARKNKVIALLDDMRSITSWEWDAVEQYRLVAGWATTNLAQAAALIGYHDVDFTRFLTQVCYPIMDWTTGGNWHGSFADSKLAIAVYVGDAALYADAKAYFYKRIAQSNYHSAYDGNKVVPITNANGTANVSATLDQWGAYFGAAQIKNDFTFIDPSYVVDGFNGETIRDLGHVSMALGAWMHGARTILAHGDTLDKQAYDRLRAAYTLHGKRVLQYLNTTTIPVPVPVKGTGGGALNQSWLGARKLFGAATPADVVTLCGRLEVLGYPAAGANHLVDEMFADGP
ncbi:MAG: DNRLRE domain-containing protein [Byssovorax sp.]